MSFMGMDRLFECLHHPFADAFSIVGGGGNIRVDIRGNAKG